MGSSFDRTNCDDWVSIGRVKRIGARFENANCASWQSRMGKQREPVRFPIQQYRIRAESVPKSSRNSAASVPLRNLASTLSHAIYAWERRLLNLLSGFQKGAVHIVLNPCRRALLAQVSRG